MTILAVAGDRCSTTAVALAASWPAGDDVLLVEADPSGGDLAAWFDLPVTPSLSTVVTRALDLRPRSVARSRPRRAISEETTMETSNRVLDTLLKELDLPHVEEGLREG